MTLLLFLSYIKLHPIQERVRLFRIPRLQYEKGNLYQRFPFVIQQGSCITIAYNRVGVESVLSLSMDSV